MTLYRIAGFVLIALPVGFNLIFFALGRAFEYPEILRKPTGYVLERFAAGGNRLVRLWYLFAMTALLAIPMALLVQAVFAETYPQIAAASGIIGTLSGLVQAMGLLRWPLLVPMLAAQHGTGSPAKREAVEAVFEGFHQYVGVVVGEHLGYLFTGSWTILVSVMMFSFNPLVGGLGIMAAAGVMVGLLEPAGWKPAGAINAISYIVWSLWLVAAGVTLVLM